MVVVSSAGHSGAASATWEHVHRHFAVAALLVARNAAYPSGGPKIDSHVDFDLDGGMEASRLHAAVKSEPVCGDHSAHRRDMRAFQSEAIAGKALFGRWCKQVRTAADNRCGQL